MIVCMDLDTSTRSPASILLDWLQRQQVSWERRESSGGDLTRLEFIGRVERPVGGPEEIRLSRLGTEDGALEAVHIGVCAPGGSSFQDIPVQGPRDVRLAEGLHSLLTKTTSNQIASRLAGSGVRALPDRAIVAPVGHHRGPVGLGHLHDPPWCGCIESSDAEDGLD
jgi:hypothetical protein